MGHFEKDTTLEAHCEYLLEKSNTLYQEIEILYMSVKKNLSVNSVLTVMQTIGTLNALLHEARTIDCLIADNLTKVSILPESITALLTKRQDHLDKIYHNNQNVTIDADNIKSLLRYEITSMSTNRTAIKGYNPPRAERKRLISTSF